MNILKKIIKLANDTDSKGLYNISDELDKIAKIISTATSETEDIKKVVIMRSPSGGGKSTKAREIKKKYDDLGLSTAIHSTDDLFIEQGVYKFDPSKIMENHNKNFDNFKNSLDKGVNVIIIDNTNIRDFEYTRYVNEAISKGYEVEYSQFGKDFGFDNEGKQVSLDELKRRVRERKERDPAAADPPDEAINAQYNNFKII